MKYFRNKDGYLCEKDQNGKIKILVEEDKMENPFMFSVDDECDDAWEDKGGIDRPWTE